MGTVSNPSRGFAACAALVASMVLLAACGPGGATSRPTTSPSGVGALGGAAPPAKPPTTKPPVIASAYPNSAKAYAEAVLAAWKAGNLAKLADLTTAEVHEQIIEIPGPPNLSWSFMSCEALRTSAACSFYNGDGDEIVLRISNQLLGKAHAATQVTFEAISFPNEGVAYVQEFVDAWQKGNKAKMNAFAVASVVTYANATTPPTSPSYPEPTCCGGGLLQVVVEWGANDVTFDVGTTKLGAGDAIVGHTA